MILLARRGLRAGISFKGSIFVGAHAHAAPDVAAEMVPHAILAGQVWQHCTGARDVGATVVPAVGVRGATVVGRVHPTHETHAHQASEGDYS